MSGTLDVGSDVAGYRLESLIGRGGMAVVYRADDLRLDRKVALKLLAPELSQHEQFRQRFVRESRLAASLDHPNIIPIYEAGEAEGVLYIVMRYVAGSDLKAVLERDRPLDPGRTLSLFAQIGDALDAAHMLGLVHRDVKPGNILISSGADRGEHVYLTDFGLTKRTSSLSGLTGTGHFLGTIDYVAPEQISGKPVEPRTDIYAMGCMLYECLTGALPFHREDDAAMLWAHLVENPPPVSALRPDVPAEVDAVVARAMAKAPEERHATCRELVLGMEEALGIAVTRPVPRQRQDSRPVIDVRSPTEQWHDRKQAASQASFEASQASVASHPSFPPGSYDPRYDGVSSLEEEADYRADEEAEAGPPSDQEWEAAPKGRRRWLVPLAAGAVVLVATLVTAFLLAGGGQKSVHFTKNTIVPFSFDRPADWTEQDAGVDVVFSPTAAQAGPLFTSKGAPDAWAAAATEVRQRPRGVVGLYTSFTSTQLDNTTADTLQAALQPLLPTEVTFERTDRKVIVGGFAADVVGGVLTDPVSGTTLRFATYVVQVPPQQMSVQLTFFSTPNRFAANQTVFDKVVRSVNFLS